MPPLKTGEAFVWAGDLNLKWAIAGTGVKLPGWDIPFGGQWPEGWYDIFDVVGPPIVRNRNPREPIIGEFHDYLGSIRGGGGGGGRGGGGGGGGGGRGGGGGGRGGGNAGPGTSITFEVLTPEYEIWRKLNALGSIEVAPQVATRTLKINAGATANGSVGIVLNGGTSVPIAVTASDTAAGVATKIAAGTFTGWTATANNDTVTFVAASPGLKTGVFSISPADTGVTGTFGVVHPGHWGMVSDFVEPEGNHHIMIGLELIPRSSSQRSGFFPEKRLVRGFGLECENTAESEDVLGRTGRDALLTPNAQLECIPTELDDAQVAGTGLESALDPEGRFFYAHTPLADPAV